jgi:drug/metabolite transporter (DMT)-like permease
MGWILIAIISYFLVALEIILDKFLLSSRRVSHPAVYAFYSGVLSLGALLIFSPFGFHLVSFSNAVLLFIAGLIFTYGILCLFFAISRSEASQAIPVVGAMIPLTTYFLSLVFLKEHLLGHQLLGVAVLIIGGLLISFDLPLEINKRKFFSGFYYSIGAGVLLAVAFTSFKHFYEQDNFLNVFIWTRIGLFIGALTLLAIPAWRLIIFNSFAGLKKDKKEKGENIKTSVLFVLNKVLGGSGSILTNWAISLGSVTIVNALVSTEYAFILLMGIAFSVWFPQIFREKRDVKSLIEKIVAIILITTGVVLISLK